MYHRFLNIIIGGDLKNRYSPSCKRVEKRETKVNKNSIHRLVDVDIL